MLHAIRALLLSAVVASAAPAATFDYVIVGGGTAGVALATRLSQGLPNSKILLLEAGPAAPDELRINVPGMRGAGLGSVYDWNFTSIPQKNLEGRIIDVNRGKVLGGSSALNYLCYDRASVAEYNAWQELGSEGWNWDHMIEAMVKSENFTGDDGDRHGRSGPIKSIYNRNMPEILSTWKPTMNSLGIPTNNKSLGGDPIGVMFQPTNIDSTRWNRSYSANSYLPLAGPNLEVRTNSRVARIVFDQGSGKPLRAIGVSLEDGTNIPAGKEVILSAGSIQTPGLLELSGIGQPAVLKAANITPILELPGVGENYQDHIRVSNVYELRPNLTSYDPLIYDSGGKFASEQLQLWLDHKVSWYDNTSSAYSFLNWGQILKNDSAAEAELLRLATADVDQSGSGGVVNRKKLDFLRDPSVPQLEVIMENNYVGAAGFPGGKFLTIIFTLMHPMSRGSVHVNASSPRGAPIIDPRYLSSSYDVRAMVEGAKFSRRLAETQPMASLWTAEFEPGPKVMTDEQWRAFAVKSVLSFYHPVGTAAMLPERDGGVVGANLVVHGTSNLRVVDCSVMPILLSGHIQTAAYGIAEIAAQRIIRDAQK